MSCILQQTVRGKERQRSEFSNGISELPPPKRSRSRANAFHSTAFDNSLSKVWLTRRSLEELDRRTTELPIYDLQPFYSQDNSADKQALRRFARHGGPELGDLRGYPAPTHIVRTMSPVDSFKTKNTKFTTSRSRSSNTTRSSAYGKDFELQLIDNKIFPRGYEYPDDNDAPEPKIEGLHERLAQRRPSLSPTYFTTSHFRAFERENDRIMIEDEVMREVIPTIVGNSNIPNRTNLLFTDLDSITNNKTVDAKPDFYDGARRRDFDKRVLDEMGKFIIPTGYPTAPVAPNFFLEVKCPNGNACIAKRQACHNGALGARGMHQLQSYGQEEPVYDGNAYTITSTYHDGQLKLYTTHPTQGEDPKQSTEYHMTHLRSFSMTDTAETFRQGATAFRNARDWAQEQRDSLIKAANERARRPIGEPAPFPSSLHDATSHPVSVQYRAYPTQYQESVDYTWYDMSQPDVDDERGGYLHAESSTPESPSPFDCSAESDTYPTEESDETSADELVIGTVLDRPSQKRRHQAYKKMASKAQCRSDNTTGRRPRSKP